MRLCLHGNAAGLRCEAAVSTGIMDLTAGLTLEYSFIVLHQIQVVGKQGHGATGPQGHQTIFHIPYLEDTNE